MSPPVSCVPIGFLESERKGKISCRFTGNSTHTLGTFLWATMFIIWKGMGETLGTGRSGTHWGLRSVGKEEWKG